MISRRSINNNEVEVHLWIRPSTQDSIFNLPITHLIAVLYPDSQTYNISGRFWETNHTYTNGPCSPEFLANEWALMMINGLSAQGLTTPSNSIYFKNLGFAYQGLSGIYWDPNWGTTSDNWNTTDGLGIFDLYRDIGITNLSDEMQGLYENAWSSIKADNYAVFNITLGSTANHNTILNNISAVTGGTSSSIIINLSDAGLTYGSFDIGDRCILTNELNTVYTRVRDYLYNETNKTAKLICNPPFRLTSINGSIVDPLNLGSYLTRVYNKDLASFFTVGSTASRPITKVYQFSSGSTTQNICGTLLGYTANTSNLTGSITIGYPFFSNREPLPPRWIGQGLGALEKEVRNGADDFLNISGILSFNSTAAGPTFAFSTTGYSGSSYTDVRIYYPNGYGLSGATTSGLVTTNGGILNKNPEIGLWHDYGRETIKYWTRAVFEAIAATCASNNIPSPAMYVDDNEDYITQGQRWLYRPGAYNTMQTGALGFMKKDSRANVKTITRGETLNQLLADSKFDQINQQLATYYYPYPTGTANSPAGTEVAVGATPMFQINTLLFEVVENTRYEAIYAQAARSFPNIRTTGWKSAPVGSDYVYDNGKRFVVAGGADNRHQQQIFLGTHQNTVCYPTYACYTGNVDSEFNVEPYLSEGLTAQTRRTTLKLFKYNIDGISAGCDELGYTKNISLWITPPGWSSGRDSNLYSYTGISRSRYAIIESDMLEIMKYAYDNGGSKTFMIWADDTANYITTSITGATSGSNISGTVYHFKNSSDTQYDFSGTVDTFTVNSGVLSMYRALAHTGTNLLTSYGSQDTLMGVTGYFSKSSSGNVKFSVNTSTDITPVIDYRRLEAFMTRVDNLFNADLDAVVLVNGSTYGFGPLTVNFAAGIRGSAEVISYSWQLLGADGPVHATGTTASYTYTTPGTYSAIFTASSYGRTESVITNIIVLSQNNGSSYSSEYITINGRIVPKENNKRNKFLNEIV